MWDEVSVWGATIRAGLNTGSSLAIANLLKRLHKILKSDAVRKIIIEAVETISDAVQSVVDDYLEGEDIDVYNILMEVILGPAARKTSKTLPAKTPKLDKKIKTTENAIDRQKRLVTPESRNQRKTDLKQLETKREKLGKQKAAINEAKKISVEKVVKEVPKKTEKEISKSAPSNKQDENESTEQNKHDWGVVPKF